MQYQTLVFDLDGTISDPFEGISKSINCALDSLGYDTAPDEMIRSMIGPPLDDSFKLLIGEKNSAIISELVHKYRERYAAVGFSENVIYPEIPATIAALAEKGYRVGVCTSKRADYATAIVEMIELAPHFDFIDGGGDGVNKTQQLERLVSQELDAGSSIMIGDRHFDILAARANGIRSVGVTWGFADENEFSDAAPDYIVDSPAELLRLFT